MPSNNTSKGPQEDCFNLADEYSQPFFVAKQYTYEKKHPDDSTEIKAIYSYESYKTVHHFLKKYEKLPQEKRTYFELIRENRPCLEYYDIEWTLTDNIAPALQEEHILNQLVEYRNSFTSKYHVDPADCRVTSASHLERKKGSIHVVVFGKHAFHNNHVDMDAFMKAFRKYIESTTKQQTLSQSIDWTVYTRNRTMRCLGSIKCKDPNRPLVEATWHKSSMDAPSNEFYITNYTIPDIEFVDLNQISQVPKNQSNAVSISKALSKNLKFQTTSPQFSDDQKKTAEVLKDAAMGIFRESKASKSMAEQFEATSLVPLEGGVRVLLTRKASGHCILCKRVHDSDNAFLQINLLGKIFYACRRNHRKRELIGRLKGENKLQERDLVSFSSDNDFVADEEYSERFLKYSNIRKSLVIKSATGTGKNKYLEKFIMRNPHFIYVAVSCRKTLAEHLCNLPKFVSYLDSKTGTIQGDRVVIQLESFWRLDLDYYKKYQDKLVLILDESISLAKQLCSRTTMGIKHNIVVNLFEQFLRESHRMIALDANQSNAFVEILKKYRNDIFVIHNKYKIHVDDTFLFHDSEKLLLDRMIAELGNDKKIWIGSTYSAKKTEALHLSLEKRGFKGICLTKNTKESKKRDIIKNIQTVLDGDIQYFIHTPTVSVGVDFNVQDKVDYVVGYFNTYSDVDVETCIQMLRRARYPKEKTYLVHMNDRFSNLPVESKDIEDWLCNQDQLIRDGPKDADLLEYDGSASFELKLKETFYSQIYINVKIMQNLSKNDFVGRFISFIKEAGGAIQGIDNIESDNDIVSLTQDIQEFQTKIQESENEKIASAPDIGLLEYETLKNQRGTSRELDGDKATMQRYYLQIVYRLSDTKVITPEWLNLYNSDKEIKIFHNLSRIRDGIESGIKYEQARDCAILDYIDSNDSKNAESIHERADSTYTRLKYATDFLLICGFNDPFSEEKIKRTFIEKSLKQAWPDVCENLNMICTTLGISRPTHNNWIFKYQLAFMNRVMESILGLKVKRTTNRAHSFEIQHTSNVGKIRELEFGPVFTPWSE